MKKGIRISLYILFALISMLSLIVIDASIAKLKGTHPILSIKTEDEKEQYIKYTGIFYKMWVCTAEENNYKYGKNEKQAPVCPKRINFDEQGNYVNFNNLLISKKEYAIINDYYTYEMINKFNTETDLDNAITISKEMHEKNFTTKEGYFTYLGNTKYMIAMFENFVEYTSGEWKWIIEENDVKSHYCIKYNDETVNYEFSKYNGVECEEEFKPLEFSDQWCDLVKENNVNEMIKEVSKKYCK